VLLSREIVSKVLVERVNRRYRAALLCRARTLVKFERKITGKNPVQIAYRSIYV
jgi:hypothetical protein